MSVPQYRCPVHGSPVLTDSDGARLVCHHCSAPVTLVSDDPDYSPAYQDEYQRLWHEAANQRQALVVRSDVLERERNVALDRITALEIALEEREWAARRMLQALDAYWLSYEGLPSLDGKKRYPRGRYDAEDWWNRYERYRALLIGGAR